MTSPSRAPDAAGSVAPPALVDARKIVGVGDQQSQAPPLPMSLDQPERELLVEVRPIERPHQQIHHDGFPPQKSGRCPGAHTVVGKAGQPALCEPPLAEAPS